ncbi:MAG TPA: metallophosphoesterase [Candidatus Hydrogenedentes bacterium]|nr:metallophosphoesterase [Candidatus Hydrogenedentota bacterium]
MPVEPGVLWLQFAHITDTHVLDDESPARTVRLADLFYESWRPQEAYTTQVLDATLQVLNAYHTGALQPQRRLDFVMHTGDAVDNAQYNELRWFMNTMDGGIVRPDSGLLDGPLRPVAPEDNPKLPFLAEGLLPEIPWYIARGNHDAQCSGTFRIATEAENPVDWMAPLLCPVAAVLGLHAFGMHGLSPTVDKSPAIILGSMDVADPDSMRLRWDRLDCGTIPPDPRRQFVDAARFAAEHFNSTALPPGHGLAYKPPLYYSVRPKADVPIRLVVLDTTAPDPPDGVPIAHGVMTRKQFEQFLKPQFAEAEAAGEYVLVASHHPSADFNLFYGPGTVGTREFRAYLASQPRMIAHICGHNHRNHLEMVSGRYPYPEIETCSLIDYPQEVRIIGLYYIEETGDWRIESTMVSHMDNPTRLSAESFRRVSLSVGFEPSRESFEKRYGMAPEDVFPPDSAVLKRIGEDRAWTKEETGGNSGDRNFSLVLPRQIARKSP